MRRRASRIGGFSMVVAAMLACSRGAERTERPRFAPGATNLVLVTLDTVRADRLPAYGFRGIETPALDRIAREGVRFANAATSVPFTLPAHATILTGLYPPRHGVRENVGFALAPEIETAAERLAAGGYDTAGFVSAFVLDSRWGIGQGFETYRDDFDPAAIEGANLASAQHDGAETVAAAIDWLERRSERSTDSRPFFLWVHLYDAHDPYTPPEPFASRYPGKPYEAEIAYVDALVGRLTEALERRALLERSALVVTADHGEGLGEHREQYHGFFVYDATVHVPLLLRLPERALTGMTVATAVSHADLTPTLLDLAGLPADPALDGESLLTIATAPFDPARAAYSESLYPLLHYGWAPLRALRSADRKWIEAPRPELYRLDRDPGERENAFDTERRSAVALRDRLADLRVRLDAAAKAAAGAAKPADLDEESLAQLAALGYVAGSGGVSLEEEGSTPRADPKEKIEIHHRIMAAQTALGEGELGDARRLLERIVAEDAGVVDAHQMLGALALREAKWDDASAAFRRALALDGEHLASLFGLANAYRRLGRHDEALVGFERLLQLSPHDRKAALAAADLLAERGETKRALALIERASLERDAPPILANQLGELLVAEGRRDEARAAFERAIAANPELAQPWFNLGVLAEEAGELDAAIARYEGAVARAPKQFQALFNLGRIAGARGDLTRQIELWGRAIEANPGFLRGHYLLAKLLMDSGGDLARAESLVRAALARESAASAGPLGHYLLADLLNRAGRRSEADAEAAKGRALDRRSRAGTAERAPDRGARGGSAGPARP